MVPVNNKNKDSDRISDNPRRDIIAGASAVGLFFFGFAGWASVTPLDAAVVASGSVIVSGNRQAVQHRDGGTIRELLVSEGDIVEEGQILIRLDSSELRAQLMSLGARRVELEAQKARLLIEESASGKLVEPVRWAGLPAQERSAAQAVLERQKAELSARLGAKGSRISLLRQEIAEMEARLPGQSREIASLEEQIRLLDEEIAGLNILLEKKLAPIERIRGLERQRADLFGRIGRIESEAAQTREGVRRAEGEISSLMADNRASRAEELRLVESELAEIIPRHEALAGQVERTEIRAPAAGEVVALSVFTVGGVIQPGEQVMDIVPTGRALVVEAAVSPAQGDDVLIGSAAKVRLSGLHHRASDTLEGKITRMSADRMIDAQSGMSYFRVEVAVDAQQLAEFAEGSNSMGIMLRPGIPAEVVIPTRKRTALQYVIEPLHQSLWRSFREA
jgi:HlyD family secretion protein